MSIIDVHQDAISRYLNGGCGDGFPKWVIPARYANQLRTPNNADDCRSWKLTILLDPTVRGTWDAFYANENGVRDAFLNMWASLAGEAPSSSPSSLALLLLLCPGVFLLSPITLH